MWWKAVQMYDSAKPGDVSLDVTQAIGQAIRNEDLQGVQAEAKAETRHRPKGIPDNPFEYAKFRNFTTFAEGTDCRRPLLVVAVNLP